MKVCLAGMRDGCLRVVKNKNQIGYIHPQKHRTPKEVVYYNPTADHGGVRLRVYVFTQHSMSIKVARLKN
jgi:hypothetical protein